MTQLSDPPVVRPVWRPRTEVDLLHEQLLAVDRFLEARRASAAVLSAAALSREERLDVARRQDVLRRERDALVAQVHRQLESCGAPLQRRAPRRVMIAHRNEWFAGKLAQALVARGLRISGCLDNGADAVGAIVAEQPDAVLVEDALQMVPGEQVVRDLRAFCAHTVVLAQVAYGDRVGALLEAGAATVFTRNVPPDDVAQTIAEAVPADADLS